MHEEVPTRYKAPSGFFPSTCWEMVGEASRKDGKEADLEAMRRFCLSYWYPLYAWARQSGMKAEDAEDLIQGFFERLIEKDFLASADEGKGRLRSFLIVCVKRHAKDVRERQQAGKEMRGKPCRLISNGRKTNFPTTPTLRRHRT